MLKQGIPLTPNPGAGRGKKPSPWLVAGALRGRSNKRLSNTLHRSHRAHGVREDPGVFTLK